MCGASFPEAQETGLGGRLASASRVLLVFLATQMSSSKQAPPIPHWLLPFIIGATPHLPSPAPIPHLSPLLLFKLWPSCCFPQTPPPKSPAFIPYFLWILPSLPRVPGGLHWLQDPPFCPHCKPCRSFPVLGLVPEAARVVAKLAAWLVTLASFVDQVLEDIFHDGAVVRPETQLLGAAGRPRRYPKKPWGEGGTRLRGCLSPAKEWGSIVAITIRSRCFFCLADRLPF